MDNFSKVWSYWKINEEGFFNLISNRVKCKYKCKIQFGFNVQFQLSLVLLEIKLNTMYGTQCKVKL
jgi:hypothetical protein